MFIVFEELEPVLVVEDTNGNPEQACQVIFYGDYHYCGDIGAGLVQFCVGGVEFEKRRYRTILCWLCCADGPGASGSPAGARV